MHNISGLTYTNVLLFYVISFSVLTDCLLIYCVVFIVFYCVAYSLFFFSITFDGVCPSLIKLHRYLASLLGKN